MADLPFSVHRRETYMTILANDEGNNVVRLWQNDWMLYMLLEGSIGYPPFDSQQAVNHAGIELNDLAPFLEKPL